MRYTWIGLMGSIAVVGAACADHGERVSKSSPPSLSSHPSKRAVERLADLRRRPMLYSQGMDLGVGYNMRTGEILSAAQCLASFEMVRNPVLNRTEKNLIVVRNKDEFKGILGIGGGASFLVGPVTVNLAAHFAGLMDEKSTSVFALVVLDRKIAEYRIAGPTLSDQPLAPYGLSMAARELYSQDRTTFEQVCGDHFVQSIVTGGRFVGLIEIEASSASNKLAIEASLSGRFNPLGVTVTGSFLLQLEDLASRYRMRIHVVSQGVASPSMFDVDVDALAQYPVGDNPEEQERQYLQEIAHRDLEGFLSEVSAFYRKMDPLEAEADYRQHAFLATVDGYEQLVAGSSIDPTAILLIRQSIADRLDTYDDLGRRLRESIDSPERFEWDDASPSHTSRDFLEDMLVEVRHALRMLESVARRCSRAFEPQCLSESELTQLPIKSVEEVAASLPRRKNLLPTTCLELQKHFNVRSDGVQTLYLGGDQNKPFDVYCERMGDHPNDGTDATPQPYLAVGAQGTQRVSEGTQPPFNFSIHIASGGQASNDAVDDAAADLPPDELVSVFERVPVHINPDSVIVSWLEPADGLGRYGAASTCSEHPFVRGNAEGSLWPSDKMANIDLRRTSFYVAPTVAWQGRAPVEWVSEEDGYHQALADAQVRGGSLATVTSDQDHQELSQQLQHMEPEGAAWIGLRCLSGEDRFQWESGYAFDYTPWLQHPEGTCVQEQCVALTASGAFVIEDCEARLTYLIEYGKSDFAVVPTEASDDLETERAQMDLFLSSLDGSCAYLEPQDDLILLYHSEDGSP